jgi:cell division protein FtsB
VRKSGAAGKGPRAPRRSPSTARRSRAARPTRSAPRAAADRQRRQTTLTARAAVLAVALASVALAVALPFKIWLGQRGDIAALATQTRQARAHVHELAAQRRRWHDPAYVEQQARERLHYVLPGQKTYVVLGMPRGQSSHPSSSDGSTSSAAWYSQLWQSVQAAGRENSGR